MKIVFRALCFSLAAVISTGATAAQTFDCKITETGRGGWVTERYIFKVDLAKNKATVLDGLVNHMFKHRSQPGFLTPTSVQHGSNGMSKVCRQ